MRTAGAESLDDFASTIARRASALREDTSAKKAIKKKAKKKSQDKDKSGEKPLNTDLAEDQDHTKSDDEDTDNSATEEEEDDEILDETEKKKMKKAVLPTKY